VHRLPRIFWLSGQTQRPEAGAGNALGWLLGRSLRPAAVGLLAWQGGYVNERAVLSTRPAQPQDVASLASLLDQVAGLSRQAGQGQQMPLGNLDADPACDDEACPGARVARAWLQDLAKTP